MVYTVTITSSTGSTVVSGPVLSDTPAATGAPRAER